MGNAYPNRKPTRLSFYSYSNAGCFFITICARNKEKLFGSIVGEGAAPTTPRWYDLRRQVR